MGDSVVGEDKSYRQDNISIREKPVEQNQREIPFSDQKESLIGVIQVNQDRDYRLQQSQQEKYTPVYPIPLPSRLIDDPPQIKADLGSSKRRSIESLIE